MRKINNKAILVITLMICYLVLSFFFLMNFNVNNYINIINPIFWFLLLIMSYLFFKNEYVNKKYKYDILLTEIIIIILFFIIYYLSGLITGFSKGPYSISLISILTNILSVAIVVFSQEFIREKLINRSGRNKKVAVLVTILLILIDLIRYIFVYEFSSGETMFRFIVEILNPMIAKHSLLTYLTYNAGMTNSLLYRMVMDCFSFIVPFEPNLGWFLLGTINIVLPFIIYIQIHEIFEKYDKKDEYKKNYKKTLFYTPIFILLTIMVLLVSGVFKHQFIAIASNSMSPKFNRGDAVIIQKLTPEEINDIQIGDVIVFEKEKVLVVHRVTEKTKNENNKIIFKTKGDYNENEDLGYVKQSQVVGKYNVTIKWVGYPSILLQELISEWSGSNS